MLISDIDEIIGRLGPAEKAALRLLIDIPGPKLTLDTRKFLEKYPWTGVIFFPKNIQGEAGLSMLIHQIQSIGKEKLPGFPLLIAVDQEGGSVSPLEGLVTPSPGNMALGASGNIEGTYQLSRQVGREMRSLGFNVDFSPVVDVNSDPRNPIIGIRAFGENAEDVCNFGNAVIRAYQEEGVMATAKHFPGHGDTSKDSHLELPVVDRSRDTLEKIDFLPFEKAVEAGVWGIMTAHVIFPGVDSKPATLSHAILTDLLREKMGFQGIIFTDSFDMAAIKEHFSLEEAVLESVKAGADVLLALGSRKAQLKIHSILTKAIESNILSHEEMLPSLRRILTYRKKLGQFTPSDSFKIPEKLAQTLHEQGVTLVSGKEKLPLRGPKKVLLSPEATAHVLLFQRHFSSWEFIQWPWPSSSDATVAFVSERRAFSPEAESALIEASARLECVASFGSPYILAKLSNVPVRLATYHLNELLIKEAHMALALGKETHGKLPITL